MATAAQREAEARCRRDGGALDTVILPDTPNDWWYIGCPYDALHQAKDIVANFGDDCGVRIETSDGRTIDAAAIKEARY